MVFKREISDEEESNGESAVEQNEFAQMLNESFDKKQKRLKVGDRIQSEVLTFGKSHVIVSTGTPHDGFVPRQELLDENEMPKVKNGDKIDLFVTYIKGTEIFLSPKARR